MNSHAGGPDGSAELGGFLGVVFQSDGRGFGVLDGSVRLIAAMGPVWRNQGRGWVGGVHFHGRVAVGAVVVLWARRVGMRVLHPLGRVGVIYGWSEWGS